MTTLRHLWDRFYKPILLLLALGSVFIWGVVVGRDLRPAAAPTATEPAASPPPEGGSSEFVQEIGPGQSLEFNLDPPPPGLTPPADPRLRLRVDIRADDTDQPVRGDVWLTVVRGEESEDRLIREQTSLVEVTLPGSAEAEAVYLKVIAPGYRLWQLGLRHQIRFDGRSPCRSASSRWARAVAAAADLPRVSSCGRSLTAPPRPSLKLWPVS